MLGCMLSFSVPLTQFRSSGFFIGNCKVSNIMLSSVKFPGKWKSIFFIWSSDIIGHVHDKGLEPPCFFSTE